MITVADQEQRFQVPTYKRFAMVLDKGSGCWVFDDKGEKYLDLYGGHAVTATGHCHPKVVEAIKSQTEQLIFYSNLVHLEVRALASQALINFVPEGLDKVFYVNSGSEANDNAIKVARKYTGKKGIISFEGGFHGRSIAAISACGIEKYRQDIDPLLPDHYVASFDDLEEVESLFKQNDIAAVILEPIQSMAGMRSFSVEFLQTLRRLCDENEALLIYDEIQTGMGRIGEPLFAGQFGVTPDISTLGKAIASGIPMGAVLFSDRIANSFKFGDLGSTFGGGPIASAAMLATIDVINQEKLMSNVIEMTGKLRKALESFAHVDEVLGQGFLMGIRFHKEASLYHRYLLDRNIITGSSLDKNVLRLLPPMTLASHEIDLFLSTLADAEHL